jgi:hypothetical protein
MVRISPPCGKAQISQTASINISSLRRFPQTSRARAVMSMPISRLTFPSAYPLIAML